MAAKPPLTEDEWYDLRRVMGRCIRAGYLPERHEQKLMDRARATEPERYSQEHASLKGNAIAEINPLAPRSES